MPAHAKVSGSCIFKENALLVDKVREVKTEDLFAAGLHMLKTPAVVY